MKKLICVLLVLAAAFAALYTADHIRMAQNKPVIFSTWGKQYVPPEQTPPATDADHAASDAEDVVRYEHSGYILSLPAEYEDCITVNPAGRTEQRDHAVFEVFYRSAYAWGQEQGYDFGHLFSILRLPQAAYEQYLTGGHRTNTYAFARDAQYYYVMTVPTDQQVFTAEDEEHYQTVSERCRMAAIESLLSQDGCTAYSDDVFWDSTETYPGAHIYYRYYPYRAYADTAADGERDLYYTLMLSQPVRVGVGGIWCVERVYDAAEYGWLYAVFPGDGETTAAEIYEEIQTACDSGDSRELCDPLQAALAFVQSYYGHTRATADSFEEVQSPPEGNYRF